jgi:hypothetical protein
MHIQYSGSIVKRAQNRYLLKIAGGEFIIRVLRGSGSGSGVSGEAPDGAEPPVVPRCRSKNRHRRGAREPRSGTAAAQLAGDPPGGTARQLGRQTRSHVRTYIGCELPTRALKAGQLQDKSTR